MNTNERGPDIEDIDDQLRTDSYLWSALHKHGRERRIEAEIYTEINDLLDLRLNIMSAREKEEAQ